MLGIGLLSSGRTYSHFVAIHLDDGVLDLDAAVCTFERWVSDAVRRNAVLTQAEASAQAHAPALLEAMAIEAALRLLLDITGRLAMAKKDCIERKEEKKKNKI